MQNNQLDALRNEIDALDLNKEFLRFLQNCRLISGCILKNKGNKLKE
ncbi:hypothetical protein FACS189481_2170 [Clostridia bacterium]|nr:hypothetical protein FACS189481_2170 [Clostridia bacterium]